MIVDLHCHTYFSDGVLGPAELIRRAKNAGYKGIAITDHVDHSNYAHILSSMQQIKDYNNYDDSFIVIVGGEITHVRPNLVGDIVKRMRDMQADIIVVHGETICEPVEEGTNLAAINAGVDILAHPGLITEQEGYLAAEKGVFLEITTRKGHSGANGHVVKIARLTGAKLVVNNDAHSPGDIVGEAYTIKILQGAGLSKQEALEVIHFTVKTFEKKSGIKLDF